MQVELAMMKEVIIWTLFMMGIAFAQTGNRSNVLPPPPALSRTMVMPNPAQTVQARVSQKPSDLLENEDVRKAFGLAFVVLAGCTLVLFVLGCGSRVVVFADASDAFMSACIFIAPVVTVLVSCLLLWMLAPTHQNIAHGSIWEGVKDNPAPAFALGVGGLWWAWAILGTLVSSIRHNGIVTGTIVAVLKLGALLSLFVAWLGVLHNYNEEDNPNHSFAKVVLFGIFIWFGSKMVNGGQVMLRRSMIQDRQNGMIEV